MFAKGVSAGVLTRSQTSKASPETGFAQIKFNPISIAEHRIVARDETERSHFPETNFAALGFFAASITPDVVDEAYWFDGLDLRTCIAATESCFHPLASWPERQLFIVIREEESLKFRKESIAQKVTESIVIAAVTHWHFNRANECVQDTTHSAQNTRLSDIGK